MVYVVLQNRVKRTLLTFLITPPQTLVAFASVCLLATFPLEDGKVQYVGKQGLKTVAEKVNTFTDFVCLSAMCDQKAFVSFNVVFLYYQ